MLSYLRTREVRHSNSGRAARVTGVSGKIIRRGKRNEYGARSTIAQMTLHSPDLGVLVYVFECSWVNCLRLEVPRKGVSSMEKTWYRDSQWRREGWHHEFTANLLRPFDLQVGATNQQFYFDHGHDQVWRIELHTGSDSTVLSCTGWERQPSDLPLQPRWF